MLKKEPFKAVEAILLPDEMALYRRHIDDGNSLNDLTEEFGMSVKELHMWLNHIEDKLKKEFQK